MLEAVAAVVGIIAVASAAVAVVTYARRKMKPYYDAPVGTIVNQFDDHGKALLLIKDVDGSWVFLDETVMERVKQDVLITSDDPYDSEALTKSHARLTSIALDEQSE